MNIHYLNRYYKFLDYCKNSKHKKEHLHHILPSSMGGSDELCNLINLSIREHFIAHWILAKAFNNSQCWAAFRIMCLRFKSCSKITSKMYELSERKRIEHCTGLMVGQVWGGEEYGWITTEEYQSNKEKYNHFSKNKITVFNLKLKKHERILSTEFNPSIHKQIKTGKVNVYDNVDKIWKEIDKKEYDGVRYITHNKGLVTCYDINTNIIVQVSKDEYKLYKNIKYKHPTFGLKLKCPHCGKEGGNSLKRWHFDHCKNKGT